MGKKAARKGLRAVPRGATTAPGGADDSVAFLVVDGKRGVIRASGWETVVGRPAPTRIPPAGLLPDTLEDAIAAGIEEAERTGAAARRTASVGGRRPGPCLIIACCVSPSRAGRRTAVVVDARIGAAAAVASEGQVIRRLAHDLRSPLTSISGAAELLQGGRLGAMTEPQLKCLALMSRAIASLLEVIETAAAPYRGRGDEDAAADAAPAGGAAGR